MATNTKDTTVLNDAPIRIEVANVIESIGEAIQDSSRRLALEFAEQRGGMPTPFDEDTASKLIVEYLHGYFAKYAPQSHQFTPRHAESYLGIEPA